MKVLFLGLLLTSAVLMPCAAQQAQPTEGMGSRYESEDIGYYASHATFPFGTQLIITNLGNNRQVTVQVGGRIPGDRQWLIDISASAANALEMNNMGFTRVRIQEVPKVVKARASRAVLVKFSQVGPALRQAAGTELTVAHPSLPIGSKISITNQDTGKEVTATVNSRIRASRERIIETSAALAQVLGIGRAPTVVKIETLDK